MKRAKVAVPVLLIVSILFLSGCGVTAQMAGRLPALLGETNRNEPAPIVQVQPTPAAQVESGLLAAYEGTLADLYEKSNPSVVNIRVVQGIGATSLGPGQSPNNQGPEDFFAQGAGSGFVWDSQGDIVTNNHVVESADRIEVTFSDGTTVPAELVGADAYSDLAVLKVEVPSNQLKPLTLADSSQVRVGQLAIAIGNPFGLEGTMTVGIVSAIGRSLPVSSSSLGGPSYSIPDVIQTDAPINPGNSGGVLLDAEGKVIGVTAAIESPVQANAGIGFAIPSAIVQRVVPSLIEKGSYEHAWLGVLGANLTPDLARAMSLPEGQRGVLVIEATQGGPSEKAGLQGSQERTTIDGQQVPIGGDVITAIDGNTVESMDELIAYLAASTKAGQTVSLTVLRDGKETTVQVTLAARPTN